MSINRYFKLFLNAGAASPLVINVNQYDKDEVWHFTLFSETGEQYYPNAAAIVGKKSDGNLIANAATVDGRGYAIVTETEQMTAAPGVNRFELLIDGQIHGTANFIVLVEPSPTEGGVVSDSDLSLIQQAMDSISPSVIAQSVSDWMDDNLTPTTPVVDASLTVSGAAADAKKTGDEISDLKSQIAQNSGVPREVKQAMDALFEHMAVSSGAGFEAEYLIIHDWASSTARVTSISAVFDQSASITTDNTLNDLKQYLTVTASYSDGTREEVTGYTLSGTLASGTNTITVTYSGKTATFEVTVTGWTLEWDYTDGALPSSDEWTTTEGAGGSHTTTFVSGKGIKWTGTGWSLGYTPTEHTTTTEGTVEFVCNVEDFGTNGSIRATLANGTDCIIAFLTSEGIRVNGGSGELIADTVPSLNTDYTVRVERTATEGKIYFNDTLVYTGALRELSGTNNVLIAKTALSGTMTAYIKSMRFIHIS